MPTTIWSWNPQSVSSELHRLLRALAEEYPLAENGDGPTLTFVRTGGGISVAVRDGDATIGYGTVTEAARGLGTVLSGLVPEGQRSEDRAAFNTLGMMLDCGHNGQITTRHFRKWLRRLALLGFDTAMIYTEAGYILPDEPCFGYMRAAYTAAEMRELDQYAAGLGIEMIGCIQALGHLEQILKWPPYSGTIRDTEHVLLVGEDRTYELIEKMIAFWDSVFRSRRLHLGMDETYDLGRGKYIDRCGYRPGLEIYAEHLKRTCAMCREHGLRPMIWSDVLFRLAGGYTPVNYDDKARVPDNIRKALPEDLDLVYWDYYHDDPEHYKARIARHRELGSEPVMASGVWSWPTPWHNWQRTVSFGGACIDGCREAGLDEMLFTLWADDGSYCDVDSSLAGLTYVAEKCYGDGSVDEEVLAKRFRAVCGSDLAAHRAAARINQPLQTCSVLWDDPLLAMYLRHVAKDGTAQLRDAQKHYLDIVHELEPHRADTAAGDLGHASLVAQTMAAKTGLAARLFEAYDAGDQEALAAVRADVPALVELIEKLGRSFRQRWMAFYQPFAMEVIQIRFAGQAVRYRELAERIDEYLSGRVPTIPELDEARKGAYMPARGNRYSALATGSRVF